jgi:hypothetical protein
VAELAERAPRETDNDRHISKGVHNGSELGHVGLLRIPSGGQGGAQGGEQPRKETKKSGEAKNMGRKNEDRASPNRKTAKKQGKKNVLKKKQLRLIDL